VSDPPELEGLLAPEGYVYASTPPVSDDDPGRYHALFGRDSLITALQLMPLRPDIARATLRALAALQGRVDDPLTEEEPGKIVHEHRRAPTEHLVELGWDALFRDGELRYYGSADSTSWFLVVLASLGNGELAAELEPAWRAAGGWLERALERGGGLVRYGPRSSEGARAHSAEPSACGVGLAQQGWRDAVDPLDPAQGGSGILREDGTLPEPPLADADCQAVALVAMRGLALLSGDPEPRAAAARLQARIEAAFGPETMAREAGDREVRGAGSQLGWLLWAGALGNGAARAAAAERLAHPDVLTHFGLRTLSSEHAAFGPHNYHRGSVWPFDNWLGWGGLRAAGRSAEAERVRSGVLEALDRLGDAPELYAVTRDGPESIALANRVQAWTVGARWALENGWDGRAI
jgi:glycogen debranching enzyme